MKPRPTADYDICEDSSLGALPKLPTEVELCKRSIAPSVGLFDYI
ncbi:hypothetical protein [Candidatus Tisiphia endosymbiont of Nedyus quadrimaculatus]